MHACELGCVAIFSNAEKFQCLYSYYPLELHLRRSISLGVARGGGGGGGAVLKNHHFENLMYTKYVSI